MLSKLVTCGHWCHFLGQTSRYWSHPWSWGGMNIRAVLNSLFFSVHRGPPRVVGFCGVGFLHLIHVQVRRRNCLGGSFCLQPLILQSFGNAPISPCHCVILVKFFAPRTLDGSHGPRRPCFQTLQCPPPWLPSTNPQEVWGKKSRAGEKHYLPWDLYSPPDLN